MGPLGSQASGSARSSLDESLLPPLLTSQDIKAPHLAYVNTRLVLQSEADEESSYFLGGTVVRLFASPNSHPAVRGNLQGLQFRCAGCGRREARGGWPAGGAARCVQAPGGRQRPGCAIAGACTAPGTPRHGPLRSIPPSRSWPNPPPAPAARRRVSPGALAVQAVVNKRGECSRQPGAGAGRTALVAARCSPPSSTLRRTETHLLPSPPWDRP